MKSKFEKQLESEERGVDGTLEVDDIEDIEDVKPYDESDSVEADVDVSGPGVGTDRGSKMMVIVASGILMTVVLYFMFFRGEKTARPEKLEEVTTDFSTVSGTPAAPEVIPDLIPDDFNQLEQSSQVSDIPQLPSLPTDGDTPSGLVGVLPQFLDLPENVTNPTVPESPNQEPQVPNVPNQPQNTIPAVQNPPITQEGQTQPNNAANNGDTPNQPAVGVQDPRRTPIIAVAGAAGPTLGVGYERNIVRLNESAIEKLPDSEQTVETSVIRDMGSTIIQGKMITAVLETAINTEIPNGSVRGIVTRDVYAEAGNAVLIPRGSRLYGSYAKAQRGQDRVDIGWSRLIRPDGVDVNITFQASDQFGRAGIAGDVDNKYSSIIGNSILTSVLAVTGAIAAEKLSGSEASTTTTATDGSVTSSGSASNQIIYDASKAIIDTAGTVLEGSINTDPTIHIPQGTKLTVIINADLSLPPVQSR